MPNSSTMLTTSSSTMLTTGERILITTGIYPPQVGGPAQYAKSLKDVFVNDGHKVIVKTFHFENYLPTGIRHIFFFIKIIPSVFLSDFILALDTFSVGLPTVVAGKIFGKKVIIRTGGDFLWEQYVERTGKKVLFRNFYVQEKNNFSAKEKIIFKLTRWTLKNASKIVFSTEWQRDIFISAYDLDIENTAIIENYYGPKEEHSLPQGNIFIASSRNLVWKNLDMAKTVFSRIKSASLFSDNLPFDKFQDKIKKSYAIILVSLGDISPNLILDAIRSNKPFICTRENGLMNRIGSLGLFVDPLDERGIKEAVLKLLDKREYAKQREGIKNFTFTHTWQDIADEIIEIWKKI